MRPLNPDKLAELYDECMVDSLGNFEPINDFYVHQHWNKDLLFKVAKAYKRFFKESEITNVELYVDENVTNKEQQTYSLRMRLTC